MNITYRKLLGAFLLVLLLPPAAMALTPTGRWSGAFIALLQSRDLPLGFELFTRILKARLQTKYGFFLPRDNVSEVFSIAPSQVDAHQGLGAIRYLLNHGTLANDPGAQADFEKLFRAIIDAANYRVEQTENHTFQIVTATGAAFQFLPELELANLLPTLQNLIMRAPDSAAHNGEGGLRLGEFLQLPMDIPSNYLLQDGPNLANLLGQRVGDRDLGDNPSRYGEFVEAFRRILEDGNLDIVPVEQTYRLVRRVPACGPGQIPFVASFQARLPRNLVAALRTDVGQSGDLDLPNLNGNGSFHRIVPQPAPSSPSRSYNWTWPLTDVLGPLFLPPQLPQSAKVNLTAFLALMKDKALANDPERRLEFQDAFAAALRKAGLNVVLEEGIFFLFQPVRNNSGNWVPFETEFRPDLPVNLQDALNAGVGQDPAVRRPRLESYDPNYEPAPQPSVSSASSSSSSSSLPAAGNSGGGLMRGGCLRQ